MEIHARRFGAFFISERQSEIEMLTRNRRLIVAQAQAGVGNLQLAKQVDLHPQMICSYRAGRYSPRPAMAQRIASVLGTQASRLFPEVHDEK